MAGLNLLDALMQSQNGGAVQQLAGQFGLDQGQTQGALKALLPALSAGLKRNAAEPGGLEALMGALKQGNHDQYVDDPQRLGQPETIADGNGILGHLLGSKDVSREVAGAASARTGLNDGMLKQMLPVVAAMAMGALSKQSKQPDIGSALMGALSGGQQQGAQSSGGGMLGNILGAMMKGGNKGGSSGQASGGIDLSMLGNLLDADGDGNPADDIFDMVMKRRS